MPPYDQAPVLVLPVSGHSSLQATLTGVAVRDGQTIVNGEIGSRRGRRVAITDVFLMDGPLTVQTSPYSLWLRVGTAAFRTDPAQILAVEDFMAEVKDYAAGRWRAGNDDADAAQADSQGTATGLSHLQALEFGSEQDHDGVAS